jgi:polyisoprenoid-binding protein YceI
LKSPDFFDVARVPTATFRSTEIRAEGEGHTITGDLTLHGVTKRISFPATLAVTDAQISANAEFSINRQDFGIAYPGMPDDLIRDLVVVKLSLTLPRQS